MTSDDPMRAPVVLNDIDLEDLIDIRAALERQRRVLVAGRGSSYACRRIEDLCRRVEIKVGEMIPR